MDLNLNQVIYLQQNLGLNQTKPSIPLNARLNDKAKNNAKSDSD